MPTLEVEAVTKRIRDGRERRTVVDQVSITVGQGEMCVLRGPSGSGKTTLLAMMGAMLTPTSGEVRLDGVATSRLRDAHRAAVRRTKVGYVFQDVQLIPAMTVLDNVLLPCLPDGVAARDIDRGRHLLDRFGLSALTTANAHTLSGGEAQRVALCRALVRDPSLLLFDEPTAHLDSAHAERLLADLDALAGEGRAVVIATHDPRVLERKAEHAAHSSVHSMEDGRLVAAAPS